MWHARCATLHPAPTNSEEPMMTLTKITPASKENEMPLALQTARLDEYLTGVFGDPVKVLGLRSLGGAVVDDPKGFGYGVPFEVECRVGVRRRTVVRSEEHTSELQSLRQLVCRLLLDKKNKRQNRKL